MDYFTKWVKAEPMNMVIYKRALDFVIKNIVCRFGLLWKIVSDNEKVFDSEHFRSFCASHGTIKSFSAVERPQANEQVETINKILKATLKKKLQACKAHWPE